MKGECLEYRYDPQAEADARLASAPVIRSKRGDVCGREWVKFLHQEHESPRRIRAFDVELPNKGLPNSAAICFHGVMNEEQQVKQGWTWLQTVVAVFAVAILISALVPRCDRVASRSNQANTAGNCKQIIAALRLYAGEHDGKYPDAHSSEPTTSNDAFRILIREGVLETESVFGARLSPFVPDNIVGDAPDFPKALEAGENHWAMTKGVEDSSNALTPLVFENPASPSWPPNWNADAAGKQVKGRTWRGGRIIAGFNDSSVQTIQLESTNGTSVGPAKDSDGKDVFTRAAESMEILDIER